MDALGLTSQWTAAARARESDRPDRLFDDPFAARLAGATGFHLLDQMARVSGGNSSYLAIRTRFFDEFVSAATCSVRQFVVLAAGMDARAFRLALPPSVIWYEVEREEVLAYKEQVLAQVGAEAKCCRRAVAADLNGEWIERLSAAGFDPALPALFLVEGLTPYLDSVSVKALLSQIGALATSQSRLGIDFIGQTFLSSPFTQVYLSCLRELGLPWLFGTDNPEDLLREGGWLATASMPGDPEASWGRWPFLSARSEGSTLPRAYLVRATLP